MATTSEYALETSVALGAAQAAAEAALITAGGLLATAYVLHLVGVSGVPDAPALPDPLDGLRNLPEEIEKLGKAVIIATLIQLLTQERVEPRSRQRDDRCRPLRFIGWWGSLPPRRSSFQPGQDWYQYELVVARAGGLFGIYTRTIEAGSIDADGIDPFACRLVDAKFARDVNRPQCRLDMPPWIETSELPRLLAEFSGYRKAILTPVAVAGAQPKGLVVRTNAAISVPFFAQYLQQSGFQLGKDGFVQLVPWIGGTK